MTRLLAAALLITTIFAVDYTAHAASPLQNVRTLAHRQAQAFQHREFVAVWRTLSPRYQTACGPRSAWLARQKDNWTPGLSFSLISVRVAGAVATIRYEWRVDGRTYSYSGDRYVRIGGRWFDDLDALSGCKA